VQSIEDALEYLRQALNPRVGIEAPSDHLEALFAEPATARSGAGS
jgi:hypothetical protein